MTTTIHGEGPSSLAAISARLTVADAVWIGTALLHAITEGDGPFPVDEIVRYTESINLTDGQHQSIWQHVHQHCVANRPAQPNRACMLFETADGRRRLFREGDRRNPQREGGRIHPAWHKLPQQYAYLRNWYERSWNRPSTVATSDPLLDLAGTGKSMWDGLTPDDFVTSLRSGWMEAK